MLVYEPLGGDGDGTCASSNRDLASGGGPWLHGHTGCGCMYGEAWLLHILLELLPCVYITCPGTGNGSSEAGIRGP